MYMSPAAEEAWRSDPAARRCEALLALIGMEDAQRNTLLAQPARASRHRPGVWATDSGLYFIAAQPADYDCLGDVYTEVMEGVEHVFRRVDAERWAYLRTHLDDATPIRDALVELFGEDAITRSEAKEAA